ncbi:MAG: DUF3990 domain-containing protein [Candidatus Amulumruptor caecigallinarius]|nr:DUF3990 domain-containing protein [Candidatus Amulumruptor caecigallinarius]MCM1396827.1 DUF3990 domain-containing protein [Candidatus Amulumruptor caecigallinarius]MCM1454229.1 DUF3990 domain-containing protein [bacterium]
MILYHSSTVSVKTPDISYSRDYLDFGKGFYLTSIYDQAVKYAQRFKRRNNQAWLSTYELLYNPTDWKILQFDSYNREWLRFVSSCRAGNDNSGFDLVIGGIADDRVIQTIERYFAGELSEDDALGLLKFEKPNNQYCIRSQRMLNECLKHQASEQL